METVRAMRKRLTSQGARLWLRLRAVRPQGFHFRRQVAIGPFIVDFARLQAGLVVEVDGGQHSTDGHATRDHRRDEVLAASGFHVLRFWNAEVDAGPGVVAEAIFAWLTGARSA